MLSFLLLLVLNEEEFLLAWHDIIEAIIIELAFFQNRRTDARRVFQVISVVG